MLTVLVDLALNELEANCSDCLHKGEDAEGIRSVLKLKAENLSSVRVDWSIHETPEEREDVDPEVILVALDHFIGDTPDYHDVDDVGDASNSVADPVYDLAHNDGTDHFTDSKNAQCI